MNIGVVIPAAENRVENLKLVIQSISRGTIRPSQIVIVCDGWESKLDLTYELGIDYDVVYTKKHKPGDEQPRNVGVRKLHPSITHVWFLDSDCLVWNDTLQAYVDALKTDPDRILIGRYDWLKPGVRGLTPYSTDYEMLDPRDAHFKKYSSKHIAVGDPSFALANFSGNLMWPKKKFEEVGGFWSELHMGRCEDGELGARACSLGIPMSLVNCAEAQHLWHESNQEWKLKTNEIDVPKIDERHPWIQDRKIKVVDEDGKRLNVVCSYCGEEFNTLHIWQHEAEHHHKVFDNEN